MALPELIRVWSVGKFHLKLWDINRTDSQGKSRLAYELWYDGELIFEGSDFFCSPLHAIDSDATVGSLLTFLSLKPGDTDKEYFESYTERQMEFATTHGEELSLLAIELEERCAWEEREEPIEKEPEEGDYFTSDYGTFTQYGKVVVKIPYTFCWRTAVAEHMDANEFWPNVWFVSDHGNVSLADWADLSSN